MKLLSRQLLNKACLTGSKWHTDQILTRPHFLVLKDTQSTEIAAQGIFKLVATSGHTKGGGPSHFIFRDFSLIICMQAWIVKRGIIIFPIIFSLFFGYFSIFILHFPCLNTISTYFPAFTPSKKVEEAFRLYYKRFLSDFFACRQEFWSSFLI